MAVWRLVVVTVSWFAFLAPPIHAARLYWADDGGIHRVNLDGSQRQLVSDHTGISIAADVSGNRLYTVSGDERGRISRSNLDGTDTQFFIGLWDPPGGLFVHPITRELWWAGTREDYPEYVFRASPDGSWKAVFRPIDNDVNDIYIDVAGAKLYILDFDDNHIYRVNLDGTNREKVSYGGAEPTAMAFDLGTGKVFYDGDGGITQVNLDGTSPK
jgi:hypothetical protein